MNELFAVCCLAVMSAFYMLPFIVAFDRRSAHSGLIFFANIIFGWTVVGWFAALAFACIDTKENRTMSEYQFTSHDAPDKATIVGTATVLDDDVPVRSRDFIKTVFEIVPKLLDIYIKGDLTVRRRISDWFFSLDMDSLREEVEPHLPDHQCIMEGIGLGSSRLKCKSCGESFDKLLSNKVRIAFEQAQRNKIVTRCPSCDYVVTAIV